MNKWLEELEEEIDICTSKEIKEEAQSNMVSFGFTKKLLKEWGIESVNEFLNHCASLYTRKSSGFDMVFYSWFDEQAGQIRISAVSQSHGRLPFSCELNSTDLNQVVNGVYSENSGLFTRGVLDIWRQNI